MTVGKLIKELKKFNPDAEVDIVDRNKPDLISWGIDSLGFGRSEDCTMKNAKKVYIFGMTFDELVIRYCTIPRIANKYKKKYGTNS